jgi:hypothetical protein
VRTRVSGLGLLAKKKKKKKKIGSAKCGAQAFDRVNGGSAE